MINIIKEKLKTTKYPYAIMKNLEGAVINNINKLTENYVLKKKFEESLGYALDLTNPESFNEKIAHKKIYNRNGNLAITADKYRVRKYLKENIGNNKANDILIPLIYQTKKPRSIPFSRFQSSFIVKANHASQWNIIVDDEQYNRNKIVKACDRWLMSQFGKEKMEWAYSRVDRRVVIEKLIKDEHGDLPDDYKFFVFSGDCKVIQVDRGRHENNHTRVLLTPEWRTLPVRYEYPVCDCPEPPSRLDKMIHLAEEIGQKFNFVRVDLYCVKDSVFFGEMTHYPECGLGKFEPRSFDYKLGEYWNVSRDESIK
ncbi:hypothetical protein GGQ19_000446 [Salinibacter ruber]|uniref:ATP-grasp fold amidoligase family protein n=1 Tax=Salinibacter ruber TaxID=146919 RepID=UPI0021699A5E|nr:ATP-grasp fold amidoligase family protein [Salinibacter ruber]MCS3749295.1 hypothetical protein [Salinibacter ruber]